VWANSEVMERTFDLDGQLKTVTLGSSTGTDSALAQAFGYDTVDRLITADLAAGQAHGFAYDANGNRTSATVNGTSTTYNYVAGSHRLSSLTGGMSRSFSDDAAGNTTPTRAS